MEKEIKSMIDKIEDKKNKYEFVKSEEYLSWIESFTKKYKSFCDDSWLYKKDEIEKSDYEKIELLNLFFHYIEELASLQNILPIYEDVDDITYFFKLKNVFFKICIVIGQGAFTCIDRLENIEITSPIVKIDEEITNEELKMRELVQYIIINKDYIGKIDSAKFGVHIGHACTICAIEEKDTEKFKKWYQNGKLQKKIILKASTKKLEQLEKQFFSVRDLGFTEVENGTLLVVSLGIMTRAEAQPYIKRLQIWKDLE